MQIVELGVHSPASHRKNADTAGREASEVVEVEMEIRNPATTHPNTVSCTSQVC